eukprot:TRINITY_DN2142_c0_g1_i1.p1 TRINITY_DN2142_c0_g1~~TRINITY_DN2142_c0_g1_i1.p1  ORF type:complete len:674 (-),score=165.04 TRINITY_DN2142_c0_g1_i1:116-2098(-)
MSRGGSSECRFFNTPQGCRNGSSCPFSHNSNSGGGGSRGGSNNNHHTGNNYSNNFGYGNSNYQNNYNNNYNYDDYGDDGYVDDYSYNSNENGSHQNWGPAPTGHNNNQYYMGGGNSRGNHNQYDDWEQGPDFGGNGRGGDYYDGSPSSGGDFYEDESNQGGDWNDEYIPEEEEISQPDLQTLVQNQPEPSEELSNPRSSSRVKPQPIHDPNLVHHKENLQLSSATLTLIFSFLSIQDLISASRTCKDWYNISSSSAIWAPILYYVQKRHTSQKPNPDYIATLPPSTSIYTTQFSQSLKNTLLRNFNQIQFELEKDPVLSHISSGVITRQFVCQSLIHPDHGLLLIGGNMGIVESYDLVRRVWSREDRKLLDKTQDRAFWRTDKNLQSGAVVSMKHFTSNPDSFFTITANDCQIHEFNFPKMETRTRIKPVTSTPIYKKPTSSTNLLAGNQFEADFNESIIAISNMKAFEKKLVTFVSRSAPSTLLHELETPHPFDKLLLSPSGLFTSRTSGAQRFDINTMQLLTSYAYQSFKYHPLIVDETGNELIIGGHKNNLMVFDIRTGKQEMEFPEWVVGEGREEMVGINGNVKSVMEDWSMIVTGTDCVQVWDRRMWKWRGSFAMGHRSVNSDPVINGVHWLGERGGSVLVATEAHSSVSMWRFY